MTDRLEIKSAFTVDDAGIITGNAWPFGVPDRAGDIITKGAFASATGPLPMLAFHNPDMPVGVWNDIVETDEGLQVKGQLLVDDIEAAREMRALVRSGAVRGLSIGFEKKSWARRAPHGRTISALNLVEISLVTVPSHPGARVTSVKDARTAINLAERIHRFAAALRSERT